MKSSVSILRLRGGVAQIVAGGAASTTALTGSTEEAQFDTPESPVSGLPGSTEDEQFVK